MNNVLAIYDNTGYIISQISGTTVREPQGGVQFIWVDIPVGKQITGIDVSVTPNVPIFIDIPKTEVEILNKQVADLQYTLMMNGVI